MAQPHGFSVTLYVNAHEVELWERAEAYAKARRLGLSALVLTALERFLEDPNRDRD